MALYNSSSSSIRAETSCKCDMACEDLCMYFGAKLWSILTPAIICSDERKLSGVSFPGLMLSKVTMATIYQVMCTEEYGNNSRCWMCGFTSSHIASFCTSEGSTIKNNERHISQADYPCGIRVWHWVATQTVWVQSRRMLAQLEFRQVSLVWENYQDLCNLCTVRPLCLTVWFNLRMQTKIKLYF